MLIARRSPDNELLRPPPRQPAHPPNTHGQKHLNIMAWAEEWMGGFAKVDNRFGVPLALIFVVRHIAVRGAARTAFLIGTAVIKTHTALIDCFGVVYLKLK